MQWPRGWFSGTSDDTYIYLLGGVDLNFNTTATLWRYDPITDVTIAMSVLIGDVNANRVVNATDVLIAKSKVEPGLS